MLPLRLRRALLPLLALLPVLAACEGDSLLPAEEGFGTLAGSWNGDRWEGLGFAVLQDDTLHVIGHRPDPDAYYDEFVRFRVPFRGEGAYEVPSSGGSLEHIVGGDAGYFPRAAGTVRITAYSAASAVVRGTLRLEAKGPDGPWRFEDGTFDVPVYRSFDAVPRLRR